MINEFGLTGNENLRRGIIIGLGGTGGEVIQRVRRMVIDKFEKFDELPILKFLYIDTDTDWAKKGATSIVERDTSLSAAEVMDISIPDAKGLYEGIKDGNYPQYDWFCLEKLSGSTNVTKGAGTVRQLGRLVSGSTLPKLSADCATSSTASLQTKLPGTCLKNTPFRWTPGWTSISSQALPVEPAPVVFST